MTQEAYGNSDSEVVLNGMTCNSKQEAGTVGENEIQTS